MNEIIFASHNKGKIAEVRQILEPLNIRILSSDDIDFPEVEETGTTFEENAKLKALTTAKFCKTVCLADDSGLCVDALDGSPGVHSARYVPNRDFNKAILKLLKEMKKSSSTSRAAHLSCVIVLGYPDGSYHSFEGRIDGTIAFEPSGDGGFGFDPIFIPSGYDKTYAELETVVKNKISHRAQALKKLISYLSDKGL